MKLVALCLGSALALVALDARAQTREPTDTDLRGAYCLGELKAEGDMMAAKNRAISASPSKTPQDEELVGLFMGLNPRIQSDYQRVSAYMLPKFSFLDADSVMPAMQRGKVDGESLVSQMITPTDQSQVIAALVNRCHKLDWLPF